MSLLAREIFQLVSGFAVAANAQSIWDDYMKVARRAGFMHGLACFTSGPRPLQQRVLAHTMPKGWLQYYAKQDYAACNPLAERCRVSALPFQWAATDWDAIALAPQRRWRDDNIAAGCGHGLAVPDLSHRNGGRAIILGGDRADIDPMDRMTLYFAGLEALGHICDLTHVPMTIASVKLSNRERECLQWIAEGKNDADIGDILGLSEKTVNVYVERAKRKFGVGTRMQAVMQALRQGLIAL